MNARGGMTDPDLVARCAAALGAAEDLRDALAERLRERLAAAGDDAGEAFNVEQAAAHGFAWFSTYLRALHETLGWARRLASHDKLGELESLMVQAAFGEYLAQMAGGLPMSQGEIFRAETLVAGRGALDDFMRDPAVEGLRRAGFAPDVRRRIAALLAEGLPTRQFGDAGYDDPMLEEIRTQFARYADDHAQAAHRWHLADALIPDDVVNEMGALGVFGLTVPEAHGGAGLGKTAMCVVTEELSRGYIGLGSLGTRSEIAAELVRLGGTDAQRTRLLPLIASGKLLPTAAFTEPDTGSDLASLRTRAERDGDHYVIRGNKTWMTHGARSDLMTLLARTDPREKGYKGLSMFFVEKPRGTDANPFPMPGVKGGEIPVLGYRGMKEYEVAFDGFRVPASQLLGGVEGQGFKQLMATFESARIQTAARAVGVAQCAFELGLRYATERQQFGRAILAFPRVADKLAWMAVETMVARQLTLYAAREKDADRRCDIEAGMAKLLAARVAWANADNAVQVHGGNGYAQEYAISRVLVDARILNVFEGAGEIQAHVIARGLLSRG
jgi:(2S)-methylsuccinyl-CoA dehydrogenase